MADDESAPEGIDISRPHPARVYDYVLGGKDNYAADREYAEQAIAVAPDYPQLARANRAFLIRAVRVLAEAGVQQFLDLGTGIPTSPNTHEVARAVHPEARVVYVDNDPIVAIYNDALLAKDPLTATIQADIRRPKEILDHPELRALIDFAEPVGVMFVSMLHLIVDDDDPWGLVATFAEPMAPGSHLVISVPSAEGDPETVARSREMVAKGPIPVVFRPADQIAGFFAGFELLDPGLVDINRWRPEMASPATRLVVLGGVGRKP